MQKPVEEVKAEEAKEGTVIPELKEQDEEVFSSLLNSPVELDRAVLWQRGLNASAKSIDPRQPAQSAQADMGRNFSLPLDYMHVKGQHYRAIQSVV